MYYFYIYFSHQYLENRTVGLIKEEWTFYTFWLTLTLHTRIPLYKPLAYSNISVLSKNADLAPKRRTRIHIHFLYPHLKFSAARVSPLRLKQAGGGKTRRYKLCTPELDQWLSQMGSAPPLPMWLVTSSNHFSASHSPSLDKARRGSWP